MACSAKQCDNFLVEAIFFTILGISFCVAQNTFNLIDILNIYIYRVAQFIKSSIQLSRPFSLTCCSCWLHLHRTKKFSLRRLHCQF